MSSLQKFRRLTYVDAINLVTTQPKLAAGAIFEALHRLNCLDVDLRKAKAYAQTTMNALEALHLELGTPCPSPPADVPSRAALAAADVPITDLRFQDIGMRQAAASQLQQGELAGGQAGIGSLGSLLGLGMSPLLGGQGNQNQQLRPVAPQLDKLWRGSWIP